MAVEPLISFAVPVKNGETYIHACLSSILKSVGDITNFEILVSDNNSSDQTLKEISKIQDIRIRILKPGKEISIGENWTFASKEARGKYFKLVGADDLLCANSIQKEIALLESNPNAVAVVSRRLIIGSQGQVLLKSRGYGHYFSLVKGTDAIKKIWNSGTNLLGDPSAILFKNQIVQEYLPWESDGYPYVVDLSLYLKIFASHSFIVSGDIVSEFRIHSNSVTGSTFLGHAKQFLTLYEKTSSKSSYSIFRVYSAAYLLQTAKLIFLIYLKIVDNFRSLIGKH